MVKDGKAVDIVEDEVFTNVFKSTPDALDQTLLKLGAECFVSTFPMLIIPSLICIIYK